MVTQIHSTHPLPTTAHLAEIGPLIPHDAAVSLAALLTSPAGEQPTEVPAAPPRQAAC